MHAHDVHLVGKSCDMGLIGYDLVQHRIDKFQKRIASLPGLFHTVGIPPSEGRTMKVPAPMLGSHFPML